MDASLATAPNHTPELAKLAEKAAGHAANSKASATRKAYALAWHGFAHWCAASGLVALPAAPGAVALYMTHLEALGRAVATLALTMTAISRAHVEASHASPRTDPVVREVWAGILRGRATAGDRQRQARALEPVQLRRMVKTGTGLGAVRDRALLLVGFASGCRRAELAALDVSDVAETDDGLIVMIGRSKTDQTGKGREVGLPYGSEPSSCPVRAFRAWLASSGISEGALFRGVKYGRLTASRIDGGTVARVVKRACKRARISADGMSGHSLRAGLCTAAAKAGKSIGAIKAQTGHTSGATVERYIRRGTIFEDNAAAGLL